MTRSEATSSPSSSTVPNIRHACGVEAGDGRATGDEHARRRPPARVATPFGPTAPSRNGTSIGRGAPKPAGWIICIFAPSHSTISPRRRALQRADVVGHERPAQRLLAEREPARETGADGDRDPLGAGQVDEGGDGGGVGHRVAQARDQHARAEADRRRALGAAHQRRPDVGVQRRRVVQPRAPVAERLGDGHVVGRGHRGGEGTGQVEAHGRSLGPARRRVSGDGRGAAVVVWILFISTSTSTAPPAA